MTITVVIQKDGKTAKEKNPHERPDNMPRSGVVNELESLFYDDWLEAEKNLRTFEIDHQVVHCPHCNGCGCPTCSGFGIMNPIFPDQKKEGEIIEGTNKIKIL